MNTFYYGVNAYTHSAITSVNLRPFVYDGEIHTAEEWMQMHPELHFSSTSDIEDVLENGECLLFATTEAEALVRATCGL
jgi:hypothetical protein